MKIREIEISVWLESVIVHSRAMRFVIFKGKLYGGNCGEITEEKLRRNFVGENLKMKNTREMDLDDLEVRFRW